MSFKVIGIGEVLWDLLPAGRSWAARRRTSPITRTRWEHRPRSSPALATIASAARLSSDSRNMGLPEDNGAGGRSRADRHGDGRDSLATGSRTSPFTKTWRGIGWSSRKPALKAVRDANAICFGSLAQRNPVSREAIQRLVAAAPADALRVFDINLRQSFYSREIIEQSLRARERAEIERRRAAGSRGNVPAWANRRSNRSSAWPKASDCDGGVDPGCRGQFAISARALVRANITACPSGGHGGRRRCVYRGAGPGLAAPEGP